MIKRVPHYYDDLHVLPPGVKITVVSVVGK